MVLRAYPESLIEDESKIESFQQPEERKIIFKPIFSPSEETFNRAIKVVREIQFDEWKKSLITLIAGFIVGFLLAEILKRVR